MKAVAVVIWAFVSGLLTGQAGLGLDPGIGPAGTAVTATQAVDADSCTTFALFWDGDVVGTDNGDDGVGEVTFRVPAGSSPGSHELVATCDEIGVGEAVFTVVDSTTTTTVAPTTTETTQPDVQPEPPQTIEECEREASEAQAQLVYEPERRMVVDRTYEVRAAVALEELPPDVTFETTTTVVPLPGITCTIKADLSGADFDIEAKSAPEQSFIGTRVLEWRWDVSPKRPGDGLQLTLSFQAIIVEGDRTVPGNSKLHEAFIDVDATPVSFWSSFVGAMTDFLSHPVIAPATALVVTTFVAWLGRLLWRRFRREPQTKPG